jgi:Fur family transcriptional regulator, zinc uptake regulator
MATHALSDAQHTLQQAEALCLKRGVRFTPTRRQLFSLMLNQAGPRSAYDLMAALEAELGRRLAPPTVYRALDFLLAQGFIHRLESTHTYLPCAHIGHDHHCTYLICERCGATIEFEDAILVGRLEQGARQHGFAVTRPVVELYGHCADCCTDSAGQHRQHRCAPP